MDCARVLDMQTATVDPCLLTNLGKTGRKTSMSGASNSARQTRMVMVSVMVRSSEIHAACGQLGEHHLTTLPISAQPTPVMQMTSSSKDTKNQSVGRQFPKRQHLSWENSILVK